MWFVLLCLFLVFGGWIILTALFWFLEWIIMGISMIIQWIYETIFKD